MPLAGVFSPQTGLATAKLNLLTYVPATSWRLATYRIGEAAKRASKASSVCSGLPCMGSMH